MKYRAGFLREVQRFADTMRPQICVATEKGLAQFHDYESRGIRPQSPDKYFRFLLDGKAWWEWTLNNIAETYGTDEWPGWYCLALDFKDDAEGFLQLRKRLRKPDVCPQEFVRKEDELLAETRGEL